MDSFATRKYIISGIMILTCIIFLVRLFILQVVDPSYKKSARDNSQRIENQYPARGLIYDRNGKLLVYNVAAYDLMVDLSGPINIDTTDFCKIVKITEEFFNERIIQIKNKDDFSRHIPQIFISQISSETYAVLQEKLFKFPGFFVQSRTLRAYSDTVAAHVLGYVREVDEKTIAEDSYYKLGDYIGISGIEKFYEKELRGEKGIRILLVDVLNRVKGSYSNKKYDKPAILGKNIVSTIDLELQKYGEKLMQNKIGSIVAIEPKTGEVLAVVSSPAYSPRLLVGRNSSKNYYKLDHDTLFPLFNRALMAQYPPGSTFKTINALVALQEKVITPKTEFYCINGYTSGRLHIGCHYHDTPLDLRNAIKNSCNAYFCNTFRRIIEDSKYETIYEAFTNWEGHLRSFGFGDKLYSDFVNQKKGLVPTVSYYDKYYGEKGWKALTVLSLAIGQGEILTTPLQMANMASIIANRGYYYPPHIVKEIEDGSIDKKFYEINTTTIDSSYFEIVADGMDLAVNGGKGRTAWRAYIRDITVCGKTGTAQNPHGEDHSVFIAFAPKDTAKIAISVYVENGGFGGTWSAPIARLMIEKYLKDTITEPWVEKRIFDANLLDRSEKEN